MKTSANLRDHGLVAIVGAGPGGLTLARLLQTRGFTVRVFERDASATARAQGGSLDLRPDSGQRAIRAAGLGEVFEAVSRDHAKLFKLMDSNGDPVPTGGGDTHEDAGPEIDRGDLRRLLLESLQPGTVAWGHFLDDVNPERDGRWRLDFAGRDSVVADLVVGADGIGSKVRARLTSVQPSYVGYTMLAANIRRDLWRGSDISDVVGEGSVMFAGGDRTIFVQRCNNDLILLYFSMKVAFDPAAPAAPVETRNAALGAIRDAYADWSPELMGMLTQIEGDVQRWPLSVMPPEYRWNSQAGLTMLGDAAHAMPPFTGKGVNLALLDALELADALSADIGMKEAVRGFEAGMQHRTAREIRACLEVGRMFYGIDMRFDERIAA